MPASYPQFLQQAFANNADPAFRNIIPNTSAVPGVASLTLGFPPVTMQPEVAGGTPPLGQDFNGVLYMLSTHAVYQQTGQPYRYSAAVSAAVGGYAIGTLLGSTDGFTLWFNIIADNTSDPDAGGAGWIAMYSYGITSIGSLSGGVRVLTTAEAARNVIVLSGALIANLQVVVPNQVRRWLIVNTTSGAFSTTVKTAAGTGVDVPQGGYGAPVEVWSDATNVYNMVAPVNLPIAQDPTPLTIAQRTNNGYLYAAFFNQPSPLENYPISAVFFETGSDGFHRKIAPANLQAQLAISGFPGQVTNAQVPSGAVTQYSAAILANAALTGTPTTPTAPTGTNNSQVASTSFVASAAIGNGQNWTAPARAANVTYTNSSARPIMVAASVDGGAGQTTTFTVNGVSVAAAINGSDLCCQVIVPPGGTYRMNTTGATTLLQWAELV